MAGTQDFTGQEAEMAQIFNLPDIMLTMMEPFVDLDNQCDISNNYGDRFLHYQISEGGSISGFARSCKAINYWFNRLLLQQQFVRVTYRGPRTLSPGEFGPFIFCQTRFSDPMKSTPPPCNCVFVGVIIPDLELRKYEDLTAVLTPLQFRAWSLRLRCFKLSQCSFSLGARFRVTSDGSYRHCPAIFEGQKMEVPSGAIDACKKLLLNFSVDGNDVVEWDGVRITNPNLLASLDDGLAEAQSLNNALLRRSTRISSMDLKLPVFSRAIAKHAAWESHSIQQRLRAAQDAEEDPCPLFSESVTTLCQTALSRWRNSPVFRTSWSSHVDVDCEALNCPCIPLEPSGIMTTWANHSAGHLPPTSEFFEKSVPHELCRQIYHATLVSHSIQLCMTSRTRDFFPGLCDLGHLAGDLENFATLFKGKDRALARMIEDDLDRLEALIDGTWDELSHPIELAGRTFFATWSGDRLNYRVVWNDFDAAREDLRGSDFDVVL